MPKLSGVNYYTLINPGPSNGLDYNRKFSQVEPTMLMNLLRLEIGPRMLLEVSKVND